uniref:T-cell surface glycoprotein CD3 delta chain n=1 Tax=Equus caballus TaxID=9796 RepID=A0A5F5PV00_HORSE
MEHCRFLGSLILAALLSQVSLFKIDMDEIEERLILKCNSSIMQVEGTMGTPYKGGLDLGKRILDPRGTYMCGDAKENSSLQVYYRTADAQALLRNDQLYQPLRDRSDAQYSRLGENWPRKK